MAGEDVEEDREGLQTEKSSVGTTLKEILQGAAVASQNRTKRIFDDPVGRRCGSHDREVLVQTYQRDTGEILHDLSVLLYVRRRKWGAVRVGYAAQN